MYGEPQDAVLMLSLLTLFALGSAFFGLAAWLRWGAFQGVVALLLTGMACTMRLSMGPVGVMPAVTGWDVPIALVALTLGVWWIHRILTWTGAAYRRKWFGIAARTT
jgi:sterol desaturase/sphingolipid hydroxylase (fatty acid hydroxylase superfamily)